MHRNAAMGQSEEGEEGPPGREEGQADRRQIGVTPSDAGQSEQAGVACQGKCTKDARNNRDKFTASDQPPMVSLGNPG